MSGVKKPARHKGVLWTYSGAITGLNMNGRDSSGPSEVRVTLTAGKERDRH